MSIVDSILQILNPFTRNSFKISDSRGEKAKAKGLRQMWRLTKSVGIAAITRLVKATEVCNRGPSRDQKV